SEGFAFIPTQFEPLFYQLNATNPKDPQMCFSVNNTTPYWNSTDDRNYLDLHLHLFAGATTQEVLHDVVAESGQISMLDRTSLPNAKSFEYPIFRVESFESLEHFATELEKHQFGVHSQL